MRKTLSCLRRHSARELRELQGVSRSARTLQITRPFSAVDYLRVLIGYITSLIFGKIGIAIAHIPAGVP